MTGPTMTIITDAEREPLPRLGGITVCKLLSTLNESFVHHRRDLRLH